MPSTYLSVSQIAEWRDLLHSVGYVTRYDDARLFIGWSDEELVEIDLTERAVSKAING